MEAVASLHPGGGAVASPGAGPPPDKAPDRHRHPADPPHRPPVGDDGVLDTGRRLPPAAARAVGDLFTLTLLSAVDGSLVALAVAGRLESLGGALTVGLLVVAGAGSWLAARSAFGGRRRTGRDWLLLGLLGALTLASTVASAWVGLALGQAATLHVLPKAAGLALFAVAGDVAGLEMPRPGKVPLAAHVLALAAVAEVALAWTA